MPAKVVLTPNGCQNANWAQTRRASRREPGGWGQTEVQTVNTCSHLDKFLNLSGPPQSAQPENWEAGVGCGEEGCVR